MNMSDEQLTSPLSRELVAPLVADLLPCFGQVLIEAWDAFAITREKASRQMAFAGASSRGMLVSDFTREPAHRVFSSLPDVWVDDRFSRPWVNLAGGAVQVRFRKLTPELELCRNDSDRALHLAYHLGDPALPGMDPFTVLTAGYVLDPAEQTIKRLALVCHLGHKDVYYSIPIPLAVPASGAAAQAHGAEAGPSAPHIVAVRTANDTMSDPAPNSPAAEAGVAQMPLVPLAPPIIRSAQKAASAAAQRRKIAGQTASGATPSSTGDDSA